MPTTMKARIARSCHPRSRISGRPSANIGRRAATGAFEDFNPDRRIHLVRHPPGKGLPRLQRVTVVIGPRDTKRLGVMAQVDGQHPPRLKQGVRMQESRTGWGEHASGLVPGNQLQMLRVG